MRLLDHTGMAVTLDVGDKDKIHPPEKDAVGKRYAYRVLNKTFGFESIACRGPEYKSMKIEGGKANLKFDFALGGRTTLAKN
jgi:sialate O-acetylesterase